jgi:hypothetical protein
MPVDREVGCSILLAHAISDPTGSSTNRSLRMVWKMLSKQYEPENASNSDEIVADQLVDCTSILRETQ